MAILPVLTYPDPLLKKQSKNVVDFNAWLEELVHHMFDTMVFQNGIGLAAPQVGESLNIFVMHVPNDDSYQMPGLTHQKICMINPKIVTAEGDITYEEACLSCPELFVSVDRFKDIVVTSFDVRGKPQKHTLTDIEAVCVQHEMDHLNGILLTDKISALKREIYGKKRIRKRQDDTKVNIL